MTEAIAESIQNAVTYLTEHPDEARYTDSVATATLEGGLKFKVEGPDGGPITTDMPGGVGGGASAPTPGWYMRAALASCDATLIAMRAAQVGVKLNKLEVTVDSESDDRGFLGIDDSVPAGPLNTRVRVKASAENATPEQLHEIVDWAHHHSPVGDSICRAVPMKVEVETI